MFRRLKAWISKKRRKHGSDQDQPHGLDRQASIDPKMSVTSNQASTAAAAPPTIQQPALDPKKRASGAFVVDEDRSGLIYSSPGLEPLDRPPGAALSPRPKTQDMAPQLDGREDSEMIQGMNRLSFRADPGALKPLEHCTAGATPAGAAPAGLNLEPDSGYSSHTLPAPSAATDSSLLPPLKRVGSAAMLAASSSTKIGSESLSKLPALGEGVDGGAWFGTSSTEEVDEVEDTTSGSGPQSPLSPPLQSAEPGAPRQLELEELEEMFAEDVFVEPSEDDPNKMSASARRSMALAALNIPNSQLEPYVGTPTSTNPRGADEDFSPNGGTPVGSRSSTPLTPTLEVLYKRNTERRRSMSESRSPRRPTIESRRASVVRDSEGKKHVNEYVILKPLGKGTYGKVKLCVKTDENALFAVKILNKSVLRKKRTVGFQTMLMDVEREIAIIKKLDHPHVVKLHEVVNDPDHHKMYLIMEYVESGQLMTDDLAASRVSEERAREYVRQIILGLEYLHYQKVIHRDLKPENLLLTEDGVVKIADFGVAHLYEGDDDTIRRSAGTPAFQAPEVVSGAEFQGAPSDVWSLGVTLWMMVFGEVPFMAANEFLLYEAIREQPVKIPDSASPTLHALLSRLLEKDPAKRITLAEMKDNDWITDGGRLDELPPLAEHCYTDIDAELTEGEVNGALGSTAKFALLVQTKLRMRRALSDARERVRRASESSAAGGGPPAPPPPPSLSLSRPTLSTLAETSSEM